MWRPGRRTVETRLIISTTPYCNVLARSEARLMKYNSIPFQHQFDIWSIFLKVTFISLNVISSVFVPTVLPRPLETDGRLRMLSISISTNYFSSSPSFLHTNIPVSFLLNISSRPSWDKLGYEWWRIEWQLWQEDTRFREKFRTGCTEKLNVSDKMPKAWVAECLQRIMRKT